MCILNKHTNFFRDNTLFYNIIIWRNKRTIRIVSDFIKNTLKHTRINSIEILSLLNDEISKKEAIQLINSNDEFEQFNAIKFLITY